jgi:hypothetical protein
MVPSASLVVAFCRSPLLMLARGFFPGLAGRSFPPVTLHRGKTPRPMVHHRPNRPVRQRFSNLLPLDLQVAGRFLVMLSRLCCTCATDGQNPLPSGGRLWGGRLGMKTFNVLWCWGFLDHFLAQSDPV